MHVLVLLLGVVGVSQLMDTAGGTSDDTSSRIVLGVDHPDPCTLGVNGMYVYPPTLLLLGVVGVSQLMDTAGGTSDASDTCSRIVLGVDLLTNPSYQPFMLV